MTVWSCRSGVGGRGHTRVARVQEEVKAGRAWGRLGAERTQMGVFGATYQQPGSPSKPLEGRLEGETSEVPRSSEPETPPPGRRTWAQRLAEAQVLGMGGARRRRASGLGRGPGPWLPTGAWLKVNDG